MECGLLFGCNTTPRMSFLPECLSPASSMSSLASGCFKWRMVFEVDVGDRRDGRMPKIYRDISALVNLAKAGHLPIGGAKWRSAGWASWTIAAREILGGTGGDRGAT